MLSKRKDSDGWMYNKCEIEGWNNFQFYTLTPNGAKLWQKCSLIYYSGGSLVRIGDPNEVKQHIKIFQKYLDQIRAEVKVRNIKALHNEFLNELSVFQTEINKLRDQLKKAVKETKYSEFSMIKDDVFKLKVSLDNSQMMKDFLLYKSHLRFDSSLNKDSKEVSDNLKDEILKAKEEVAKLFEKKVRKLESENLESKNSFEVLNSEMVKKDQIIEDLQNLLKDQDEVK